jgi:hypothetical protein
VRVVRTPGIVRRGGALLVPHSGPRAPFVTILGDRIRATGMRVVASTGWETYDLRLVGSLTLHGDVVTSAYPEHHVQVRVRRRVRVSGLALTLAGLGFAAVVGPEAVLTVGALAAVDAGRGVWRTGPLVRRVVTGSTR